jgi:hypothetical protein
MTNILFDNELPPKYSAFHNPISTRPVRIPFRPVHITTMCARITFRCGHITTRFAHNIFRFGNITTVCARVAFQFGNITTMCGRVAFRPVHITTRPGQRTRRCVPATSRPRNRFAATMRMEHERCGWSLCVPGVLSRPTSSCVPCILQFTSAFRFRFSMSEF